jgi:hypothetical protein
MACRCWGDEVLILRKGKSGMEVDTEMWGSKQLLNIEKGRSERWVQGMLWGDEMRQLDRRGTQVMRSRKDTT